AAALVVQFPSDSNQLADDRLSANDPVADFNRQLHVAGKEQVGSRPEFYHTELLTRLKIITCLTPADNSPCDNPRDMSAYHRHVFTDDSKRISLIDDTSCVAGSRHFFSNRIIDPINTASDR